MVSVTCLPVVLPVSTERFLVLIPAYNEARRIGDVVSSCLKHPVDVLVVDDGSPDETKDQAEAAGASVLVQSVNGGKGLALEAGFAWATERQYDAVITMDGDGQHRADEIPLFLAAYELGHPVVVGNRMANTRDMPWIRKRTNRFMSKLLSRIMKQEVPDTQNGYRLYRTDLLPLVSAKATGFAAESESLLNIADAGIRIASVPTATIYGDERSKIRPFHDTLLFFRMLRKYWFRKSKR